MVLPVSLEERYVTPSGIVAAQRRYDTYRRFDTERGLCRRWRPAGLGLRT